MGRLWLNAPLADYEGHMSAAGVAQLAPWPSCSSRPLAHAQPRSVAMMFETIEAGLRRGMGDFVFITSACHPFLQITQPFRDLWALLYRDRWMINGSPMWKMDTAKIGS